MPIDLRQALDHHRAGRLDLAGPDYEAALAEDPARDDALHLLGLVALQGGDPARAVALIGRAVAIRSNLADYHSSLGEAYWALGRVDLAVQCGREASRLRPDDPSLLCNLGSSLVALGEVEAGVEAMRRALRLQPDLLPAHVNLGKALANRGDGDSALAHFVEALRLDPRSAEAHANLAKVLLDRGDPEGAARHASEAIRLRPGFYPAMVGLANALQELDRLGEAEACLREAIRLRPDAAPAMAELGAVLEQLGDPEASLAMFREALRVDPDHAGVLARLATRLRDRLPEPDQVAIERLLAGPRLSPDRRAGLLFGLAHVRDARREYDRAAGLSVEANQVQGDDLRRRGRGYDPRSHAEFVDRLIAAFDPAFFGRVEGWGLATDRPVFVVGMPRSGTSLVEQILASHPQVFGAGELRLVGDAFKALPARLDQLDRSGLQSLAGRYLDGLATRNGSAARVVDKMPENLLYLGLIAALFPNARWIRCRRGERDVALSCWMTHFGRVRWTCDPRHIASRIAEARRLTGHWRSVLPTPMFEVDYESIVDDPEASTRELLAWCGLEWDPACLDFHSNRRAVRTASTAQVRRPIYRGSIGRWRNYERSLADLFEDIPDHTNEDPT